MALVVNGDGNITGLTPGGLPNASITQVDLAANVAGNGPAFKIIQSVTQNITTTTWTKAVLDTEAFDTASCFNNTGSTVGGIPSYAFKPTVAGYYQINGGALLQSGSSNVAFVAIAIYVNGIANIFGSYGSVSSPSVGVTVSDVVYLNGSTDYVDLYIYAIATAPFTTNNRLSGSLVRTA